MALCWVLYGMLVSGVQAVAPVLAQADHHVARIHQSQAQAHPLVDVVRQLMSARQHGQSLTNSNPPLVATAKKTATLMKRMAALRTGMRAARLMGRARRQRMCYRRQATSAVSLKRRGNVRGVWAIGGILCQRSTQAAFA